MSFQTSQLFPKSLPTKYFRGRNTVPQQESSTTQSQASGEFEPEEKILENIERQQKFQFWRNTLCIIIIGIVQILIGALVLISGGQIFGTNHIKSGINEIMSSGLAIFQGGFSWTEWVLGKCININVSLICGGFEQISKGCNLFKNVLYNFWSGTGGTGSQNAKVFFSNFNLFFLKNLGNKLGTDLVSQGIVSPIENLTKNFVLNNVKLIRQEVLMNNFVVQKAMLLDLLKKDDFWNKILMAEAQQLSNTQGEILQRFILGVFLGVACNKSRTFSQIFAYFSKLFALFKISSFTHQLLFRLNKRIEYKYGDLIQEEIQNAKEFHEHINFEDFHKDQSFLTNSNIQNEYNQQMDEFIQDQISENFKNEFVAPVIGKFVGQGVEYSTKNYTQIVRQNTEEFCENFQQNKLENQNS